MGSIPAVSIPREDGLELAALVQAGTVEATVSVTVETISSRNVIAEMPGTNSDGSVVVLGGHYDTVANVPGLSGSVWPITRDDRQLGP